ncbi:MAG: hypothetical protein ABEH89_00990 [bacterium]
MDLEKRLEDYKTRYRSASLPGDMKQSYEQILTFVDASTTASSSADFASELASLLECKLDLLFPAARAEEELDPVDLLGENIGDYLRRYEHLEGDVKEAILEQIPGDGDETLCVFPAPFHLTPDEKRDPGLLGNVLRNLLAEFLHPTLLLRDPPHRPSRDLYDHVVIAGSSLHNLLRLIRCTAGLCPDGSTLNVAAVADERFLSSMRELIQQSDEFNYTAAETELESTLHETMRRKLRQTRRILRDEHGITVNFEIHDGTVENLADTSKYFDVSPTLLALPFHFSGGGYDPGSLEPLFKRYTSTEILTI